MNNSWRVTSRWHGFYRPLLRHKKTTHTAHENKDQSFIVKAQMAIPGNTIALKDNWPHSFTELKSM